MKLEYSRQIFEKSSNAKFHENPSSGSRVVPCERTDKHDEASRFSQSCEWASLKSLQPKGHKEAPVSLCPFRPCSYQILTTGPFFRANIFFQNTGHVYSRPVSYILLPNHRVPCIIMICIRCSIITVPRLFREKWLFVIILWTPLPNSLTNDVP
jgi:hypothetical protein